MRRMSPASLSITVTWLAPSSRARWRAIWPPTRPAPQMMIFIARAPRPRARSDVRLGFLGVTAGGDDVQRLELAVQRRALHADEVGRARDIAAETVDLRHEVLPLEHLPGLAQREAG